jgi:hypothetical protein
VENTPDVATLELAAPDDFYLVQFEDPNTGLVQTLPSFRTGTTVEFDCPTGYEELVVRTASVLQGSVRTTTDDGSGGGGAPAP